MTNTRSLVSVLLLAACGPGGVATVGEPDGSSGGSSSGSTGGGVTTGVAPTTTDGAQTTTTTTSAETTSGSTEAPSGSTGATSSEGGETTGSTGASETTSAETTTSEDDTSMFTTELPGEASVGSTGEEACVEDAVTCVGDSVKQCDGMGGFKQTFDCSVGFEIMGNCAPGVGCVSACDKAFKPPACSSGHPRVMLIMDASSSMLNLQGGLQRAKEGQGGWELMRDSIAGSFSLFEVLVPGGTFEELSYFGMLVFGHNVPDETKLIAQYGACRHDMLQWALDPATSCVAPGCTDQYAEAPISWTTRDGAWAFGEPVQSHMPTCNKGTMPQNKGCFGSGTYVHLGLQRAQQNLAAYKAACANDPDAPCDGDTQFINIVVLDGMPNSSEAEYAAPLQAMFDQGVVTHVIGFGDGVDGPNSIVALNKMASYGSGGALMYRDANNQSALEGHLATIVQGLDYGGC